MLPHDEKYRNKQKTRRLLIAITVFFLIGSKFFNPKSSKKTASILVQLQKVDGIFVDSKTNYTIGSTKPESYLRYNETVLIDTNIIKIHENKNKNDDNNDDGCINSQKVEPRWRKYTNEEAQEVQSIKECIKSSGRVGSIRIGPSMNDEFDLKLDCTIRLTVQKMRDVVKGYRTIWMIGDSILGQQSLILQCTLDA
jgi:hypothetical protein